MLAVDLGTGGPKVALVSADGEDRGQRVRARRAAPPARRRGRAGPRGVVGRHRGGRPPGARAVGGVARRAIVGVGCTAQWSGTVAVDEDGTPLRPAVIWMDSRGSAAMQTPDAGHGQRARLRRAQDPTLDPADRRGARVTRARTPPPTSCGSATPSPTSTGATFKFLEPVDWLNQRLTGRFAASTTRSPLHWVTDNRRIDADRLRRRRCSRMSGLERSKLPDLVPSATIMGPLRPEAADELGLPAGLPVATGTGDVHSAAVGSGAVADFDGHLYIGTSSWISCHVPFKKTDALRNVASIPAAIPGRTWWPTSTRRPVRA